MLISLHWILWVNHPTVSNLKKYHCWIIMGPNRLWTWGLGYIWKKSEKVEVVLQPNLVLLEEEKMSILNTKIHLEKVAK